MVARNHLRRCQDSVGVLAYLDSVTVTQVNRSDSTLLPGKHYCGAVIAPEVIVRGKTRGGFAPQDAPFRSVCARAVRHMAIVANLITPDSAVVALCNGSENPY